MHAWLIPGKEKRLCKNNAPDLVVFKWGWFGFSVFLSVPPHLQKRTRAVFALKSLPGKTYGKDSMMGEETTTGDVV